MLGDQLIKNETIALTELVKNAYDADASECNVRFLDFDAENLTNDTGASIVVEDNGNGMSYEVITKHFLNPATPIKRAKENEPPRKSLKGRIVQGEKGIGRFSMLKLGRVITIISKQEDSETVHKVVFDFAKYDDEFLTDIEKLDMEEIFLDEIIVKYENLNASDFLQGFFAKSNKGTTITIDNLKGQWHSKKISDFETGLLRFNPFELNSDEVVKNRDFTVNTYINEKKHDYQTGELEKLRDIVFHKALYKIIGKYDEKSKKLVFSCSEAGWNPKSVEILLVPIAEQIWSVSTKNRVTEDFQKLPIYQNKQECIVDFYKNGGSTECGDFEFNFYIFDFKANPKDQLGLSRDEKDIIRNHRVFLYRDDVRVQPYGAPDDDWLQIDRHRAEKRANHQFSNDQLFGQIKITKEGNEKLKDKTSREGIIEDSQAFSQLLLLVRGLLSYVRTKLYQNYNYKIINQKEQAQIAENLRTCSRRTNMIY
jgi:hypothetical protein